MKLIVGLGNPGEKYENSRHNTGFAALDTFLKDLEPLSKTFWETEKKGKVLTKQVRHGAENILLAKPQTFMNNSGFAVSYLLTFYKIDPKELIVLYDDLDLPLGKIRVRFGGAAGGHKGVESIITQIGTDTFLRIRMGIGHPRLHDGKLKEGKSHIAVEDYVLQPFAANERSKIRHMVKEAIKSIHQVLEHGQDLYMSKYNDNGQATQAKRKKI